MTDLSSLPFDTTPESRATVRALLWRQLFVVPPAVQDGDLKGKTVLITGSNRGIGLECGRQLLTFRPSRLILGVRNEEKGESAKESLLASYPQKDVSIDVWKVDMLSYDSIMELAARANTLDQLDIAVLNVGVLKPKFETTNAHSASNGNSHEESIQVNVLSTTLLSILLLPTLKPKSSSASSPSRLVVVSSDVSSFAKFKERDSRPLLPAFDDPKSYDPFQRYFVSKLLNQLAMSQLAKRVDGSRITITLPNPGLCHGTRLGMSAKVNIPDIIGTVFKRIVGRHPSVGTRTIMAAAVKFGPEAHGQYVEDGKLQPLPPLAYTPEGQRVAELLWKEMMEELSFAKPEDIIAQSFV
ncbi:NAD(P)-binding protein [Xylariaceae sp. FL1019]|nr:NAD(P)-binding protein [Xylariaceae sp. FL1019]